MSRAGAPVVSQGSRTAARSSRRIAAPKQNSTPRVQSRAGPANRSKQATSSKKPKNFRRKPGGSQKSRRRLTDLVCSDTARSAESLASAVSAPPLRPKLADSLTRPIEPSDFSDPGPTGQLHLATGRSGDHASIYHMLLAVFQGPSRDEFYAQTEDPFYEPHDRLLVKRGYRVLSHLHLIRRTMRFGQVAVPVSGVHWLGTLPEFRGEGFGLRLVHEAEKRMAEDGTLVGVVRTAVPRFFQKAGWSLCGRHCYSQAKAREVLARLQGEHSGRLAKPLSIRLWRHVEMPALMRIYQQNTQYAHGPLERTEAYWRWLVGAKRTIRCSWRLMDQTNLSWKKPLHRLSAILCLARAERLS